MLVEKIKKLFKRNTESVQPNISVDTVPLVEDIVNIPGAPSYLDTAPEIVGYQSIQEQNYMYELVSRQLTSNSILDFGCARGDFYSYRLRSTRQFVDYLGIDSNINLIESGKRLYADGPALRNDDWFNPSFSDVKDWCVNINSMNFRYDAFNLTDEEYLLKTIEVMMDHCNLGSVLILSSKFMPDEYRVNVPYIKHDPGKLLNILTDKYGKKLGSVFVDHSFSNSFFLLYILK